MLQSSESCLWKQFQKSGEEPEEEEQDRETLKTKKAPPRRRGLNIGIYGYEWGFMGMNNIHSLSRNPHKSGGRIYGWKLIPINRPCPDNSMNIQHRRTPSVMCFYWHVWNFIFQPFCPFEYNDLLKSTRTWVPNRDNNENPIGKGI